MRPRHTIHFVLLCFIAASCSDHPCSSTSFPSEVIPESAASPSNRDSSDEFDLYSAILRYNENTGEKRALVFSHTLSDNSFVTVYSQHIQTRNCFIVVIAHPISGYYASSDVQIAPAGTDTYRDSQPAHPFSELSMQRAFTTRFFDDIDFNTQYALRIKSEVFMVEGAETGSN